jgi:hypothetical protein
LKLNLLIIAEISLLNMDGDDLVGLQGWNSGCVFAHHQGFPLF